MERMTTQQAIDKAWANLVHREVTQRDRDPSELPEKCPPNAQMILEAADEIAQIRADEAVRSKHANRRNRNQGKKS
jgi:hypothetical protein